MEVRAVAVRGLIGIVEVSQICELSKAMIYRLARNGAFPRPMVLGDRYVWDEETVKQYVTEHREELTQRPICHLFPREKEVLQLAEQGLKTKEIAKKLGITNYMVEYSKHQAYVKLNVDNIRDALIRANYLGVLAL